MPIFEYHCETCDQEFELLVRSGQEPECPQCQSKALQKKWSTFAAQGGDKPSAGGGHAHHPGCGCGASMPGACGLN